MKAIILSIRSILGFLITQIRQVLKKRKHFASIGIPLFEVLRLRRAPYLINTTTVLFYKRIRINSPFWYLHGLREIFYEEAYLFKTDKDNPTIIDCGANIGLGIIYFKKNYPNSRIIAFEPDQVIYGILLENIAAYDFKQIELHNVAVWSSEGTSLFSSDGGVGGTIENSRKVPGLSDQVIRTVRLREFLKKEKTDFLKIDIEGAEFEVLNDCKDMLSNVENIFVEYHSSSSNEQKLSDILLILREACFRVYIKEAWPIIKSPLFEKSDSVYDLQLNIFGYRN